VKRIFPVFNAVIAMSFGAIVLLGYFINLPELMGGRILLLEWSVLLAGIAVLIGVGNLIFVHLQRITDEKPGAIYSLVLIVFFLVTFLLVLAVNYGPAVESYPQLLDAQNMLLNGIMVPAEISLVALLAVTLLYSSARMLRWRIDFKTVLFLITALLFLISATPWPFIGQLSSIGIPIENVIETLATGGARGILIGVALGTLTTGLRILLGADRPYGGK